jgi:hypothetical protein
MMAYQFIRANRDRYAVKKTAGLLGASRGAYYRWAVNGASQRRRAADVELVRLIFGDSGQASPPAWQPQGAPVTARWLREAGQP